MKYLEILDSEAKFGGKSEKMPQLGFGTAGIGNYNKTKQVIIEALKAGFRRFDTASMYENEEAIGDAIKVSDINRSEIFITTKLWNEGDYSHNATITEFHKSLDRLGLEYIDLYLHHWPAKKRLESWKAMEELVFEDKTRFIGVSNYTEDHIEQLLQVANIKPLLNQVEFSPFLFQEQLLQYCKNKNIILEAYSPFAKGRRFDNQLLANLSSKYNKSPAQILLRWGIQMEISIIPKASSKKHILQNIDIFDFTLTQKDIKKMNNLHENLRIEWNPTGVNL